MISRIYWSVALVSCLASCEPEQPDTVLPTVNMERWANSATVVIQGELQTLKVDCELAITPQERAKGLMYRKEPLGEDKGMLFIMDSVAEHSFWMRNTYIPLDMVFIGENETVACIVANAVPRTQTSRKCGAPSRYVLEIDGGLVQKYGIQPGQSVVVQFP